MYKHQPKMKCLRRWEAAYGTPTEMTSEQGVVCVAMGENILVLPPEMEDKLRPFMGRRIGIIRTDLPDEEYIIRTLSEEREATQDTLAIKPIVSHSNTVACEVV